MAAVDPIFTENILLRYCDPSYITAIIICDQQYMPDKVTIASALQNVLIVQCTNSGLSEFIDSLQRPPRIIYWGAITGQCIKYASSATQIHCIHDLPDIDISSPVHTHRTLNWMYRAHCLVYTDGGCQKNGSPNAVGSFAATLFNSQHGQIIVSGRVRPAIYTMDGDKLHTVATTFSAATNNRSEYLAIIQALLVVREINIHGSINILSDCRNAVQTINEWYPGWVRRGTLDERANKDLVVIMCELFQSFGGRCTITHTFAHKKPPPTSASAEAKRDHAENRNVDALATIALQFPQNTIQLVNAPYPVRKMIQEQLDL